MSAGGADRSGGGSRATAPRVFPVACVILAAGAGTRFGGPKAQAPLRPGVRFIDEIARLAADAELSPVVAVVPPALEGDEVLRQRLTMVVNADARGEQVRSLRLGIARLANTGVAGALVWPVDHPYVSLVSVLAILDAARRAGTAIVVPTFDRRRGHPTFFARAVWHELHTVPEGGARAVMHADASRVLDVAVPDDGILRDIDIPADLRTDLETRSDAIS